MALTQEPDGQGSSPPARGRAMFGKEAVKPARVIPARAGEGSSRCTRSVPSWGHPRSRGGESL